MMVIGRCGWERIIADATDYANHSTLDETKYMSWLVKAVSMHSATISGHAVLMEFSPSSPIKILSPVHDTTLNIRRLSETAGTKKRKRQDEEIVNPFFRPFSGAFLQSSPKTKPSTFTPITHLTRADLPLAWLDYSLKKGSIQPGSLLQARLEDAHVTELEEHASVLVARLCPHGGLYALERAGPHTYLVCGLQTWITESRVIQKTLGGISADADLEQLLKHQKEIPSGRSTSGRTTSGLNRIENIALKPRTPKKPTDRRGALARISLLPRNNSLGLKDAKPTGEPHESKEFVSTSDTLVQGIHDSVSDGIIPSKVMFLPTQLVLTPTEAIPEPAVPIQASDVDVLSQDVPPKADELDLDQLCKQYLETLYLSKTSLAYFAKGPLARARNQVLNCGPGAALLEALLVFYREAIISSKKLDLKYRDSINSTIASIPISDDLENAPEVGEGGNPKKRLSRKKKMGKDSLYPGEDEYVTRWWREREIRNTVSMSSDSNAQELRRLVSDLRTRETKMQILLILEVLALESGPLTNANPDSTSQLEIKFKDNPEDPKSVLAKTPNQKKKRDLKPDLDTLVERLCIWHTVGIDEMLASPEKKRKDGPGTEKDQLRDFCADVIIPYYASRLPEQCKAICRKLGGPEISPQRKRAPLTKPASSSRLRPAAAIKSRGRMVPKKTLERVLSEDQTMRHVSPPVFSRSSSASLLPSLKREPLDMFDRPGSCGTLHKTVSFSNREVDLVADARVHEAKRKKLAKMADQKKELDAAISALKKPNRTMAGQGFMDELEKRSTEKSATKRQSVHIAATPKRPSSKVQNRLDHGLSTQYEADVHSEDPVILSSAIRPRLLLPQFTQPRSSATKRAVLFAIHETPSRPVNQPKEIDDVHVSRLSFSKVVETSQVYSQETNVQCTPATNRLRPDTLNHIQNTPMRMTKSMKPVLITPVKKAEIRVEDAFRDAPVIPERAGKAMDRVMGGGRAAEMSIYDSLGWNDDDLDDL